MDTSDDGGEGTPRGDEIREKDRGTIPFIFDRMFSKGKDTMSYNTMVGGTKVKGRRVVEDAMDRMMKKRSTKISRTIFKKKKGAKSSTRKGIRMGVENFKTVSSQSGIQRFLSRGRGIIGIEAEDNGFGKGELPGELIKCT